MSKVIVIFNEKNIMAVMSAYLSSLLISGEKEYYIRFPENLQISEVYQFIFFGIKAPEILTKESTECTVVSFLNVLIENQNSNHRQIKCSKCMIENVFEYFSLGIIPNSIFHILIASTYPLSHFTIYSRKIVESLMYSDFFNIVSFRLQSNSEIDCNLNYDSHLKIGNIILDYRYHNVYKSCKNVRSCIINTDYGPVKCWYVFERKNKIYLAETMQKVKFPDGSNPSCSIVISYNFENKTYEIVGSGRVYPLGNYTILSGNCFKTEYNHDEFQSIFNNTSNSFYFPKLSDNSVEPCSTFILDKYKQYVKNKRNIYAINESIIEESSDFKNINDKLKNGFKSVIYFYFDVNISKYRICEYSKTRTTYRLEDASTFYSNTLINVVKVK